MNLRVGTDDVRSQLRNPMKLARGLGSAKSGVEHWWVQRLTAAALVALGIWFVITVLGLLHADYATAHATVAKPWRRDFSSAGRMPFKRMRSASLVLGCALQTNSSAKRKA